MANSLKTGTIYLTLSSFIFIVTGYFINVWLGRFLGPTDYGNYGVIIGLISLVNMIQTSGLTQTAAKYIAENEKDGDAIFKSALNIQIVATLIISTIYYLSAPVIADLLNDNSLVPFLQLSTLIFPLYGLYALYIDYYNGRHNFKKQAIINSLYSITKLVAVLLFAYFYHLKGVLWGFIVAPFLSILAGFYYPKGSVNSFTYKKLLLFSIPLIGYVIFSTLLQSLDLYMVKSFLSGEYAGYYTASQNISKLVFYATISLSSVLLPSISKSVSNNLLAKAQSTISISMRYALMLIIPSVLLIATTSNQLLELIYSSVYTPASVSLSILAFAYGFFSIFTILCTIINGSGKPKYSLLLSLFGTIIITLLCILLIPQYNIVGAAIASLVSNFLVMLIAAIYISNRFNKFINFYSLIRIILSSIIVSVVAIFIILPVTMLPLLYLALFAIYLLLLKVMKEFNENDTKIILSVLPSKILSKYKI